MNAILHISKNLYTIPYGAFTLIGSSDIDHVYAWLYDEEDKDLPERMSRLDQCLRELVDLQLSEQQRYHLMEIFLSSLIQIKHRLSHISLGFLKEPFTRHHMIQLCRHAVDVYMEIIQNAIIPVYQIGFFSSRPTLQVVGPYLGYPIHRALELMTYIYYESQRWRIPIGDKFWCKVHQLYHMARTQEQHYFKVNSIGLMTSADLCIESLYNRMLLLSQCKLSQLNLRDLSQVYDFCTLACLNLNLSVRPQPDDQFMVDPDLDTSFIPYHKCRPKEGSYFLSFNAVSHLIQHSPVIRQRFSQDRLGYLAERFAS